MRTPILLSMMALATAPAALADTTPAAESCVLKVPLKATRPGGMAQWETLSSGIALSLVSKKPDWSRVRHGDTVHIVATAQLAQVCGAVEPTPAPAAESAKPAPAVVVAEAKAEAAPAVVVAEAKAEAAPAVVVAEAKAEAAPAVVVAEAKAEAAPAAEAKAETPKAIAAATTKKTEAQPAEAKKAKTELLPSQPSSGQLFVLGLLLLGAVFTGVFLRRRAVVEQSHLDVVATRTLGRGKQLVIVNAGEARLLLGVTEQGITLLSSTPASEGQSEAPSERSSLRASDRSSEWSSERSSERAKSKPSLLTEEEEAATASPARSFLKGLGAKVGNLWGRPPAGPPAEWDNFDRILASAVPESSVDDEPPAKPRRSSERASSGGGAADIADLARELQRHGARRTA
ncbi:MAG: flagellar biosynthetic protein FliO [Deltaproteobacteria bacterium]|nr:flagellar biosynthetic protein FliO [Deltaproteobacteria bacterium]